MKLLFTLLPLFVLLAVIPVALGEAPPVVHGLAPLPEDQRVPHRMLPPGSEDPDDGPSPVVYPEQKITLRFNHAKHVSNEVGLTCRSCHGAAYKSHSAQDSLLPTGAVCDSCHGTDHANVQAVKAGQDATGACGYCHQGYKTSDGNLVAELELPRANLLFDHSAHVTRNIGCAQCHGAIEKLELATRDQLPRMAGCFKCHQMDDASRGDAKSACDVCHIRGAGDAIQTMFASGTMTPPRWLHNAEHTPDFLARHKLVAADDSQFCANCHKEEFCTDCHDGRVRPRTIHPNDYLNMHAIEARMETQKCQSCHQEQGFCLDCHMRVGVSESSPPAAKDSARFHPDKSIWSDPPLKPGHHGFEAERNLNQCVSCHTERDCVTCHGAGGIGAGFNPHKNGFLGGCAMQYRRNPRPCLACHEPTDSALSQCR